DDEARAAVDACPAASVDVGGVPDVAGPHPAGRGVRAPADLVDVGGVDRGQVPAGPRGQRVAGRGHVGHEGVRAGHRVAFAFVRARVAARRAGGRVDRAAGADPVGVWGGRVAAVEDVRHGGGGGGGGHGGIGPFG